LAGNAIALKRPMRLFSVPGPAPLSESEDLRVTRWLAIRFRVLPFLPWTILFNNGLGDAVTFEPDQNLGTEGREDREEVENWQ
jgi:hypothetical protein